MFQTLEQRAGALEKACQKGEQHWEGVWDRGSPGRGDFMNKGIARSLSHPKSWLGSDIRCTEYSGGVIHQVLNVLRLHYCHTLMLILGCPICCVPQEGTMHVDLNASSPPAPPHQVFW